MSSVLAHELITGVPAEITKLSKLDLVRTGAPPGLQELVTCLLQEPWANPVADPHALVQEAVHAPSLTSVVDACSKLVPVSKKGLVTPEFVESAAEAIAAGAPGSLRITEQDGVKLVEVEVFKAWLAWLVGVGPAHVTPSVFAEERHVCEEDVRALAEAGALDSTVHGRLGLLITKEQPLVNPVHLVSVQEACEDTGRKDVTPNRVVEAAHTNLSLRLFNLGGTQVGSGTRHQHR